MKFKVGDRVLLNSESNYYSQAPDIEGTIKNIKEPGFTLPFDVLFDNQYRNTYNEEDLLLVEKKKEIKLDSVILASDKKEQIKAAISQLANTKMIFEDWGFEEVFEKGTAVTLLFWGIPGTGKTLMAQAIADELQAELKIYGTGEIQTSEPGGAERTIKRIFEDARKFFKQKKKTRVILFDECDSLLYDRDKVGVILAAQINALLSEIERHEGVIIFTTNRMGKLDPALERRIAAKIEFPFPNKIQRKAIWLRMIPKKAPITTSGKEKVDFKKLAEFPLAGGNIKNVVLNAARQAAYEKAKQITMTHFVNAIEKEAEAAQAFSSEYEKDLKIYQVFERNSGEKINIVRNS